MYAELNGVRHILYENSSASSEQSAMEMIEAIGGADRIMMGAKTDAFYKVIRAYYSESGEYKSDYWVVYKDSVFDIVSKTFNTNNSFYWGNPNRRLHNFLDNYIEIKNAESKLFDSDFVDNPSEYIYTGIYFLKEGSIKLYQCDISIDKQTGRFTIVDRQLLREVAI
jgi:hypothetical protein